MAKTSARKKRGKPRPHPICEQVTRTDLLTGIKTLADADATGDPRLVWDTLGKLGLLTPASRRKILDGLSNDVAAEVELLFPFIDDALFHGPWRNLNAAQPTIEPGQLAEPLRLRAERIREVAGLGEAAPSVDEQPVWNPERRELSFNGQVKQFNMQPAVNQTAVLESFQKQGWAKRVELPVRKDQIGDAVRSLNKWAGSLGLKFSRDGTGRGIIWDQGSMEVP